MIEALIRYRVPIAIAMVAIFAVGLFFLLDHSNERAVTQAVERGVEQERAAGAAEVINRVKEANNARETVRRDGSARYDECLRSATDPANCQRFMRD